MDYLMGLPKTKSMTNTICVIVDRLTKFAHFIVMANARVYINEIVHLHGVPSSIVSDRDMRFQAGF